MKRIALILSAAVLCVLMLAACTDSGQKKPDTAAQEDITPSQAETTDPAAEGIEPSGGDYEFFDDEQEPPEEDYGAEEDFGEKENFSNENELPPEVF